MQSMIADWLTSAGLGGLKPLLATLLLPPLPFLALALAGAWLARARLSTGRACVAAGCIGVWLSCCTGAAQWVEHAWLAEPAPLNAAQRSELKARAAAGEPMAIVVLGGGMTDNAAEYGAADLANLSLSRLRYGVWLGRQTGIPVAASGGRGWSANYPSQPAEATRMAEIAQAELATPLRWVEATSRDTHENATNTLALLQASGVREVVLVTHGTHMPRALREFRASAAAASSAASSARIVIVPASMGQAYPASTTLLKWLPSGQGLERMIAALHEVLAALGDRR
jgi:uncharacterized SAM-binding protein YcdF (DUF218 family)